MAQNRIHPLTGAPVNGHHHASGVDAPSLDEYSRGSTSAMLSYDNARSGTDLDGHWAHADALDADAANSPAVRQRLAYRSRYEAGSNGYYCGVLGSQADMIVGTGPSLRMLSGNRDFNQLVEREFAAWAKAIQLNRKLWCMAHAMTQDGESFAVLQTNPGVKHAVQLDVLPLEAEQCQSLQAWQPGETRPDGIHTDDFGNIVAYDILPHHPGGENAILNQKPVPVASANVVHWFKLKRPSAHRGIPSMTSTLGVGAVSRRVREATATAVETAASIAAIMKTQTGPDIEPMAARPFTTIPMQRRTMMSLPRGWDASQMESKHPNATYESFHRQQISETARPISMPYNAAACDSSTYSFASGKLDFLMYRVALDVNRTDCDLLALDIIFAAWFREWTTVAARRDIPPEHQWDWPSHPVIDSMQESRAIDTRLKNNTTTLRQVYSDAGQDFEDQLVIMAEDYFGEASEENITKARQICVLKNTPSSCMNQVANILGIVPPVKPTTDQPVAAQGV